MRLSQIQDHVQYLRNNIVFCEILSEILAIYFTKIPNVRNKNSFIRFIVVLPNVRNKNSFMSFMVVLQILVYELHGCFTDSRL